MIDGYLVGDGFSSGCSGLGSVVHRSRGGAVQGAGAESKALMDLLILVTYVVVIPLMVYYHRCK